MKILLVRPPAPNKLSFAGILDNEPLELEYLHTVLMKENYIDYIFDGMIELVPFEKVLLREKPDVVAITGYITQEKIMIDYCKKAKSYNSSIVTIVGGVHVQLNYKRFYCNEIDYMLRSESLDSFMHLIKYIDSRIFKNNNCDTVDLNQINGLIHNGIVNDLIPIDINSLPIPNRDHFYANINKYRYLDLSPIATVKGSFSCPYNCNFCYCTLLGGGKYNARDIDLLVKEIKDIKCDNIQLVDDDFLVDIDRVYKFIRLIRENNINKTYICYTRADFVSKHADIIKELVSIGFKYFLVGLEAINNSTLEAYNKQTSDEINRKCVENIKNAKGECIGLFIVNYDATPSDFKNIVKWVKAVGINHVTVSMFTPIPGTPLYDEYKDKIISDDISDWDFLHLVIKPTKISSKRFYYEYYKMFIQLYNIAKKTGIYDFMDIKYYKKILGNYLKRKMLGL